MLHLPLLGVQTNHFFLLSAFTFSSSLYLSLFAWPVTTKRMTKGGGDTSALNGKRRGRKRKKGRGKGWGKGRGVKLVDWFILADWMWRPRERGGGRIAGGEEKGVEITSAGIYLAYNRYKFINKRWKGIVSEAFYVCAKCACVWRMQLLRMGGKKAPPISSPPLIESESEKMLNQCSWERKSPISARDVFDAKLNFFPFPQTCRKCTFSLRGPRTSEGLGGY